MRTLEKNKTLVYYKNYASKTANTSGGNKTGEYTLTYGTATALYANVSAVMGQSTPQQFGISEQYDRVMVLDALPSGMNEATLFWIDEVTTNPHNYIVKRIIPSLNSYTIGLSQVKVSA